eukprot:TRINITY_DN23198_c0_g1_i2.p1 TRINITY_DN23198_c0_g1~~TRINITY_DN23198_c0_g1_i2.p1  ORF type:complete len:514 (-),score=80.68 TRINITY_DN23198_c0_g1_i2:153-1694(-)
MRKRFGVGKQQDMLQGATVFVEEKGEIDKAKAFRMASFTFLLMMIAWGIAMTVFLLMIASRYVFSTIDDSRLWYAADGSGRMALARVTRSLSAALEVRQAMRMALCRGLIVSPSDSAAMERVLTPILLGRAGSLRAVELAFSDRATQLVVTRKRASDGNWMGMIRSTDRDCYLLGLEGCLDPDKASSWKAEAMELGAEATLYPERTDHVCLGVVNASTEEALAWEEAPQLLQQQLDDDGFDEDIALANTAWYPSYRLLFRTGFSYNAGAGEEPVIVVGRVIIELGELSGEALQDSRLGEGGKVFLCDSSGRLLTASELPDLIEVEPLGTGEPGGKIALRSVWTLGPWAAGTRAAFRGTDVMALRYIEKEAAVVVLPLPAPHTRFAIVVFSPISGPFTDYFLFTSSIISFILAGLPYATGFLSGAVIIMRTWYMFVSNPDKNPLNKSDAPPLSGAEMAEAKAELGVGLVKRLTVIIPRSFGSGFKRLRTSMRASIVGARTSIASNSPPVFVPPS